MNILGISCFYHDSAACLVQDGKVVAAAQEERFNRDKYSQDFPINAINFCLQEGNITSYDIDYIAFYEKPYLKLSRVLLTHLKSFPFSLKNFLSNMPSWFEDRLIVPLKIEKELGYKGKTIFLKHHLSHAASAFLVSPFKEAAIMTADGVGEWTTTTCGKGSGNDIEIFREMRYPDSLGLLYSIVTTFLGFRVFSGEGKVMGLSSYGKPVYLDKFREIIKVKDDGSFHLDPAYFTFNKGSRMYSKKFIKLFGDPRVPESGFEQRHYDMAATLQNFVEEVLIKIANKLYEETKLDNLCLAGGLFLNCVANYRLINETPFKNVFIQPAAGDSGGALGAAMYVHNTILGNERIFEMKTTAYGPQFSENSIKRALLNSELPLKKLEPEEVPKYAAKLLAENKIIGWLQGRMEFGPRAMGNRSILANPCTAEIKDILNAKVKKRESFRPFAPVVLEEKADKYFDLHRPSPFMLLAPPVKEEMKKVVPGITHVDGTARVQTINKDDDARYWELISEFEKLTGVAVIVNTSFNLRGEPIVCSPEEAINCYKNSEIDCLIMGDYITEKSGV